MGPGGTRLKTRPGPHRRFAPAFPAPQILAFLCTNYVGKAPCDSVPPAPGDAAATARRSLQSKSKAPAPAPGCTAYFRQARTEGRRNRRGAEGRPPPPLHAASVVGHVLPFWWAAACVATACKVLSRFAALSVVGNETQVTVLSTVTLVAQPPKYYNGNWVRPSPHAGPSREMTVAARRLRRRDTESALARTPPAPFF